MLNNDATKTGQRCMHQRIGIIDLGSNTTRMIVVVYQPHYAYKLVDEIKETVRLIEGAGASNVLQPIPIERAVKALRMFSTLGKATNVPNIIGIATSVVRDARNPALVLHQMIEATGIRRHE